jgi:hypothetical protein
MLMEGPSASTRARSFRPRPRSRTGWSGASNHRASSPSAFRRRISTQSLSRIQYEDAN